jgi:hypothetical protein
LQATRIRAVDHVAGERVVVDLGLGVPPGVERVSVRLESDADQAYYVTNGTPSVVTPSLVVGDGRARLRGVTTVGEGDASVPVDGRDELQVTVFADYGAGSGFSYRFEVPTATTDERTRALTPYVEVCRQALRCGGEAAYIPGGMRDGVAVETDLRATNATAADPVTAGSTAS